MDCIIGIINNRKNLYLIRGIRVHKKTIFVN
jgi:hypothetical protein